MKKKYKPCCSKTCLVSGCETNELGGCYCVCRLVDAENTCLGLLEGKFFRQGGGIIYIPGRLVPLVGPEKEETEKELIIIRERLKSYEIKE